MVDYCIKIFFYYPNESKRNTKKALKFSDFKIPHKFLRIREFLNLKSHNNHYHSSVHLV